MADTKNAEFTVHKDIWKNSQYKEETNNPTQATVLKSALSGKR